MASKNIQEHRLYKGTINPQQINSSAEFNQMPGRTNPYRYYDLSPDYYDVLGKPGKNTQSFGTTHEPRQAHTKEYKPENASKLRQGKQQQDTETKSVVIAPRNRAPKNSKNCCWRSKRQIHPEKNNSSDMQTRANTQMRDVDDTWVKIPNEINKQRKGDRAPAQNSIFERPTTRAGFGKELNFPATLSSRPQNKPKRKEFGSSGPNSTHPAATETLQQNHTNSLPQVISPGTMAFNPLYKETTMSSPLVPVTLEDYDGSFPVKRVSSKALVTGNPLIPVMTPAERVANSDLYSSRDSPVSSDFYGGHDYEHDYSYRRYTTIPSYNAVGFMLNDSDCYSD
ncbi:hypothetical protein BsWGS_24498 [Bradybaena similaris]